MPDYASRQYDIESRFNQDIKEAQFLVKVFSQKKYRDEFVRGDIAFGSADYFRNLKEKDQRADSREGVEFTPKAQFIIELPNSQLVSFIGENIEETLPGDGSYSLFCASRLDKNNLKRSETGKLQFCKNFVEKAMGFGEFGVIFTHAELFNNIKPVIENDPRFCNASLRHIIYRDRNASVLDDELERYRTPDYPYPFFEKDLDYKYENEFRICAVPTEGSNLYNSGTLDRIFIKIKPFELFNCFQTSGMMDLDIEKILKDMSGKLS